MAYEMSYDEQNGMVRVTGSGMVSKKDHYEAWKAAALLCQEHSCSKVLVNLRDLSTNSFSTMESFRFGEEVAMTPGFLHIAYVLPKPQKARENVQFASTVQANRGKSTGEFETVGEAMKWLLSMK